jgi:site-specific DNA-cytosine methylase
MDDKGTGFGFKVKESNDKGNSLRANAAICPTDNMVMAGQLGFKKDFKESEKAQTLLQRDYKGMSNHGINVVIVHNTMPRSSKTGKGGTGHLTRDDGKTYCLDTKQSNAVEIVLTSKDKRLKQTIINNELELDKVKALDVYNQSIHDIYPTLKDPIHNDRALFDGNRIRRLTPIECERLQTVKDNYTNHVSNSQRYKMLGNGWTVSVISHILSYMNGKS